jgi:hypothetical protein
VSDLWQGRQRRPDERGVVRACRRASIIVGTMLLVGAPAAGCNTQHDYSGLLLPYIRLDPADEFIPGPIDKNPDGKPGVSTVFKSWGRTIADTILVFPDAAEAASALEQGRTSAARVVKGGTSEPVPVGGGGTMISGRSPDGSAFVTVLLFSEDIAFTTMEFRSTPDRGPIESSFIVPVGQQQDARIKDHLRR